jgi:hypothetical protein
MDFSQAELYMLSNAILLTLDKLNECSAVLGSLETDTGAIRDKSKAYRTLHEKICQAMEK